MNAQEAHMRPTLGGNRSRPWVATSEFPNDFRCRGRDSNP
jgi:hypothetical protein